MYYITDNRIYCLIFDEITYKFFFYFFTAYFIKVFNAEYKVVGNSVSDSDKVVC